MGYLLHTQIDLDGGQHMHRIVIFLVIYNEHLQVLEIEFVAFAIEFIHLAIEFVALARKFVMTEEASRNQPPVSG